MPRSQRDSVILEIKRLVRERDRKCAKCGMTNEECLRVRRKSLDVHRITPASAYSIGGCIAMCAVCHGSEPKSLPGQGDYQNRTGERLQVYLAPDLMAELRRRAAANHRTITAELELLLRSATGIPEPLPKVEPSLPEVKPKRPVGRPKKGGA